jgi:PPOX class probable F420-dependent enzyme
MDLETLAKAKYLSLTTFRRDGTPVATPVWLARLGDELLVSTVTSTGKAKRLRNNSRVLLAPCDMRGRVTGDAVVGTARLQDDAASAVTFDLIRRRYGLMGRLMTWMGDRRSKGQSVGSRVGVAIRLGEPEQG